MSLNLNWDSNLFEKAEFPYDRIEAELSDKPRLFRGTNSYVTYGGKLGKRPGTTQIDNSTIAKRCDRLWVYETIESPPKVYIIGSFYNSVTGRWNLYYNRLSGGSPGWTSITSYRDSDLSTRPHELVVSRGLAYIKCFPSSGSSEKLGTIIFDGSGNGSPQTRPWGLLGPTEPAAIVGAVTRLNGAINSSTTSITVVSDTGFPSTPFTIQVDFEEMIVTSGLPGTSWTVTRAANGTTAAEHDDNSVVIYRDWDDSAHKVDVNWYWRYSYEIETVTGQISNRAPVQTNIDKLPSSTGPFFDLIPKIEVEGPNDTTNFPYLIISRTTDGGGTYYRLDRVANTGGTITYEDNQLETGTSGGVFEDPIPDDVIDAATPSPSLTSNSPPPTVLEPLVIGVDTPQASTPIVSYATRNWYGIGNVVFFSGQEEITDGIPEECWPSGFRGNYFRFQFPVTNLQATSDALYVFTIQATYQITGTNRETFNVRPIFENIGHPYGHPRAVTRWGDVLAFLTHDFRIALINDSNIKIVSDPLFTDLVDQSATYTTEFDIKYWGDIDKEYLIISGHVISNTLRSKQWVLDLKKTGRKTNFEEYESFWFTPWTIRATASLSGRISETTGQRRMVFFIWNNTDATGSLVMLDPTGRTGTDFYPDSDGGSNIGFDFNVETSLFNVPTGNHVNQLRLGGIVPVVYGFVYDRTLYPADTDPAHYCYLDDFWTDPIPVNVENWPRRRPSKGYKTIFCPVQQVAQHCAFKIQKINSTELFEMQNLTIIWNPDAGA